MKIGIEPVLKTTGSSLVELVIVTPVLMLLGLGTVQAALLYHAKSTLNYATFEAARKGAVKNAQTEEMKKELGVRLGPVFGGNGEPEEALKAMMTAMIDVKMPLYTSMTVINPTVEAFDDWGTLNPENGKIEIPNSHLRHRHSERVSGATSGVTLQDANLLKIEVKYGYRMSVPLVDKLFARAMMLVDPDNSTFYAARRIPLTSVATVRMQSPAQKDSNITVASMEINGSGDPTQLVDATSNPPIVLCDPYGIREDLDNDALDSLFNSDPGLSCPGLSVIGTSQGGNGLFPGSTEQQSNASSFTDCV